MGDEKLKRPSTISKVGDAVAPVVVPNVGVKIERTSPPKTEEKSEK